jgi:hypothetical protein
MEFAKKSVGETVKALYFLQSYFLETYSRSIGVWYLDAESTAFSTKPFQTLEFTKLLYGWQTWKVIVGFANSGDQWWSVPGLRISKLGMFILPVASDLCWFVLK